MRPRNGSLLCLYLYHLDWSLQQHLCSCFHDAAGGRRRWLPLKAVRRGERRGLVFLVRLHFHDFAPHSLKKTWESVIFQTVLICHLTVSPSSAVWTPSPEKEAREEVPVSYPRGATHHGGEILFLKGAGQAWQFRDWVSIQTNSTQVLGEALDLY